MASGKSHLHQSRELFQLFQKCFFVISTPWHTSTFDAKFFAPLAGIPRRAFCTFFGTCLAANKYRRVVPVDSLWSPNSLLLFWFRLRCRSTNVWLQALLFDNFTLSLYVRILIAQCAPFFLPCRSWRFETFFFWHLKLHACPSNASVNATNACCPSRKLFS